MEHPQGQPGVHMVAELQSPAGRTIAKRWLCICFRGGAPTCQEGSDHVAIDPIFTIDPEPPHEKACTSLWDTISVRSVVDQNKLLAEAIDEQSGQLSHFNSTLAQLPCNNAELSEEVRRLTVDNKQVKREHGWPGQHSTRRIIESLSKASNACNDGTAMANIGQDKTLLY